LDEVGELSLQAQKSFLRVLQERSFLPVGGQEEVTSNFRLVSATHRNLDKEIEAARFRQDLLFRLRSIMIELPPLRDRKNDIHQIVQAHLETVRTRTGLPRRKISDEFFEILSGYNWPGNVRELLNVLDHALTMEPTCPTLYPKHLPDYIRVYTIGGKSTDLKEDDTETSAALSSKKAAFPSLKDYRRSAIENAERRYISELMLHCKGDIETACKRSHLKRARLYQLLKKYNGER
jgi:two-component system NtrC family response regulator